MTDLVDEFVVQRAKNGTYHVIRTIGQSELFYCTCRHVDTAKVVARALNKTERLVMASDLVDSPPSPIRRQAESILE